MANRVMKAKGKKLITQLRARGRWVDPGVIVTKDTTALSDYYEEYRKPPLCLPIQRTRLIADNAYHRVRIFYNDKNTCAYIVKEDRRFATTIRSRDYRSKEHAEYIYRADLVGWLE